MANPFIRRRPRSIEAPPKPSMTQLSSYELAFELIARLKESNAAEVLSTRQLLIMARAFTEELAKRASKKGNE